MTKLSDTQAIILSKASQHPDGLAVPPESLPPAPRSAVAKRLLEAGLVEVLETDEPLHPGLTWKLDGAAVFLRITPAGLQAIGVEADDGAQEAPLAASGAAEPQDAVDAAEPAQEAPTGAQEAGEGPSAGTAPAEGRTPPQPRAAGLRAAAQQVLTAWDSEDASPGRLADAIAALRAALPQPRPARIPRQPGAPRSPQTGTKQEAVLALLRRPEGASGPQMMEATGWAPHTVRGFLAGLKKRGFEVIVHERVRQVGPGKEGAKGSYTVYRIAAEPAG